MTARRQSRQQYPEDRFDRVERSRRVGAHRVTPRPRYIWQYLIAALLGFALLTGIGILAVQSIGSTGKVPSPTRSSAATKEVPELDPTATIAVLNGTEIPNLAAALDQTITAEQWGQILFSGSAEVSDVQISAVFYRDEADAAAAEGLAAKLGGISTFATTDYGDYQARLIVLIGVDYAGPGVDLANEITAGTSPGGSQGSGTEGQ
ncbi:LytR C-terminal domain-containing protein [Leucobacter luti]|uniref:LytR C-terminal domain-containing protein n=1 Tax=Leucobacter luti TaxID=340320 RepID=UPI003D010144